MKILAILAIIILVSITIPIVAEYSKKVFEIVTTKDFGLEEYDENLDE